MAASSGTTLDANASCTEPPGDINGSGGTNVADVMCAILGSLWSLQGSGPVPVCLTDRVGFADLDCANGITVVDVQLVIQLALTGTLTELIDSNANGCHDGCDALVAADCCAASTDAGCGHYFCEICVCSVDPDCCDTVWDSYCAIVAAAVCDSTCACPANSGDCCSANDNAGCEDVACADAVCALDEYCCEVSWDNSCAQCATTGVGLGGLNCASAAQICGCPPPGACCTTGGCIVTSALECDAVGGAYTSSAGCTDSDNDGYADVCGSDYECPAAINDCQTPSDAPGCASIDCCSTICAQEPSCCTVAWSAACANAAASLCSPASACCLAQGGCSPLPPSDCGAQGGVWWPGATCADADLSGVADICEDAGCCGPQSPAAGCALDPPCEGCVCDQDAYCCAVAWDELCAACASGLYCGSPPVESAACASSCVCIPSAPSQACCTTAGCVLTPAAGCLVLGGQLKAAASCADTNQSGVADACE